MSRVKIIKIIFASMTILTLSVFLPSFFYKPQNKVLNNLVRVVYISDNNYMIPLQASIKSMIANKNPKTELEINVIGVNLSDKNIKKIKRINKNNVNINIIKIDKNYLKNVNNRARFNPLVSRADNAKFYLTSILKNIDRVIYLDGDTIILGDLTDLYKTKMGDKYLAVADDFQTMYSKKDKKERYFNNGVMLLNLKKMRRDNIDEKLREYKLTDTVNRFVTQDAFNSVLYNKVVYVSLIYNTFALFYNDEKFLIKISSYLDKHFDLRVYPYANMDEYRNDIKVVHYCGYCNIKPWWEFMPEYKVNRIWYKYAPVDYWINLITGKKVKYKKCIRLTELEKAKKKKINER